MPRGRRRTEKTVLDRHAMNVVVTYLIQMEGRPTIDEVLEVSKQKLQITTTRRQVRDAIEAVRRRGLVSVVHDFDGAGKSLERYAMRDVKFSKPPEIAHIKAILPTLLESEVAQMMTEEMEDEHEDGKKKGGRLPDIRDYVRYRIVYEIVTPLLGGEPREDKVLGFRHLNGSIWIPANLWLKAAIQIKLRMKNCTTTKAKYIEFDDIFLETKSTATEVLDTMGMQGPVKHEAMMPGMRLTTMVAFPTTGFMPETQFEDCLKSIRTGAKHKDYGLLKLVEFTKLP